MQTNKNAIKGNKKLPARTINHLFFSFFLLLSFSRLHFITIHRCSFFLCIRFLFSSKSLNASQNKESCSVRGSHFSVLVFLSLPFESDTKFAFVSFSVWLLDMSKKYLIYFFIYLQVIFNAPARHSDVTVDVRMSVRKLELMLVLLWRFRIHIAS